MKKITNLRLFMEIVENIKFTTQTVVLNFKMSSSYCIKFTILSRKQLETISASF